jgi:UDP-3-O-[3-hydroxymyristoyl] glucosamine N-acyltransferase
MPAWEKPANELAMVTDPSAPVTLRELVAELGGELHGDPEWCITGVAGLDSAGPGQITFLSHPRYQALLRETRAGCVIVTTAFAGSAGVRGNCIVTESPYLYYARLTQWWRLRTGARRLSPGVHPSAVIGADVQIDPDARIGPLCVIGDGARIGAHTVLSARVTVGDGCRIGARCVVHSGVVIGADGFGFAPKPDKSWEKIEQLGSVVIGDDVEIGANTCIDRGALQDTVIEDGVKLDNLIQIGHNVQIGRHTAMAGCVGVAGSARIGAYCTVGGGAVILGHLSIADHVNISASTTVMRSITEPGLYTGVFPIDDNASWEKNAVTLRQLAKLRERIRALEQQLKN